MLKQFNILCKINPWKTTLLILELSRHNCYFYASGQISLLHASLFSKMFNIEILNFANFRIEFFKGNLCNIIDILHKQDH